MKRTGIIRFAITYIVPACIIAGIICVVYAIHRIYPFGNDSIDYHDMATQIIPFYAHTYDVLHGGKALLWDWYTGMGVNMSMGSSTCSNFSIFNLFFLFIKRDMIQESMSFFLIIKMIAMAITMQVLLTNKTKAPLFYRVIISSGYGLCGYVLLNYTTLQWLDIAALFPLIIMFYLTLIESGRAVGFVITMSLAIINSFYISAMILIFLFLLSGVYAVVSIKKNRRLYMMRLGISVVLSIAVSAFILVPQIFQMLSSSRFQNGGGTGSTDGNLLSAYMDIIRQIYPGYVTRWWILLGISLPLSVFLMGLKRDIKNKQVTRIVMLIVPFLFVALQLIIESISLFWHFGSYIHYPMRNGFVLCGWLAFASCVYTGESEMFAQEVIDNEARPNGRAKSIGVIIATVSGVLAPSVALTFYLENPGMKAEKMLLIFAAVTVMLIIADAVIIRGLSQSQKRYVPFAIGLVWFAEMIFVTTVCIGEPTYVTGYNEEYEQEGESVRIAMQLKNAFDIDADALHRIKNPDTSLNANYSLLMERGSLSNWTAMVSKERQSAAIKMGYSIQYTRLLDAGGTAFTDALLGITNTISCVSQPEALYTPIQTSEVVANHMTGEKRKYTYYDNKYTLPFGIVISSDALGQMQKIIETNELTDQVDIQNELYDIIAPNSVKSEYPTIAERISMDEYNAKITIIGNKALCLTGTWGDQEFKDITIRVNGETIGVPSISEIGNTAYPAHFNNNMLLLGCFENQDVNIEITRTGDAKPYTVGAFILDLDALSKLCTDLNSQYDDMQFSPDKSELSIKLNGDSIDATLASSKCKYMLLPISYDAGWCATVNNSPADVCDAMGLFTAIPLNCETSGTDVEPVEIQMSFCPSGMKIGMAVSFIALLCAVALAMYVRKDSELCFEKSVDTWIGRVYSAVWVAVIIGMYIVPIGYAIFGVISNHI